MVAVVGISASSRADLLAELDELGTDLLRVAPGQTAFGESTTLPESARDTADADRPGHRGRRDHRRVDDRPAHRPHRRGRDRRHRRGRRRPGGARRVSGELADGRFLDDASATAADRRARRRRGATPRHRPTPTPASGCGSAAQWFAVIGILEPAPLAPDLDSAALIGYPVAAELFDTTTVAVDAVRAHRPRAGRGGARRARPLGRPGDAERGRRVPAVRRPRGPGRHRRGAAQPAARPRRRRPRRRRRRHHQRDGDLGARTARRDRRAPGARRPPRAHRRPVPRRGGGARLLGGIAGVAIGSAVTALYARSQGWLVDVPAVRRSAPGRRRPSPSGCSPASPRRSAPPASTPPRRYARVSRDHPTSDAGPLTSFEHDLEPSGSS